MSFIEPNEKGFTIYSKSGCINCNKVKTLLKEKNLIFSIVDCDEYIIEDKENFLLFIKEKANKEIKFFPMVFNDSKFIGGYNETVEFIEKLFLTFEEILNF
jgi:glutaredoxin